MFADDRLNDIVIECRGICQNPLSKLLGSLLVRREQREIQQLQITVMDRNVQPAAALKWLITKGDILLVTLALHGAFHRGNNIITIGFCCDIPKLLRTFNTDAGHSVNLLVLIVDGASDGIVVNQRLNGFLICEEIDISCKSPPKYAMILGRWPKSRPVHNKNVR